MNAHTHTPIPGTITPDRLVRILRNFDAESKDYATAEKREKFATALSHLTGATEESRLLAIKFFRSAPGFKSKEELSAKKWRRFLKRPSEGLISLLITGPVNAVGGGSVFNMAEDDQEAQLSRGLKVHGGGKAENTIKNTLKAVYRSNLNPQWDELKQKVVFGCENLPWDEAYGRELNDHTARVVRSYLITKNAVNDFQPSKENVFEAVMTIAYGRKFSPVVDYLASVQPTWDGIGRIDRLFSDYIKCGDDAYTRAVSRCFFIGAVRRARKPGCKFDTMPILRSPQGWEKSTAIEVLFSTKWFSAAELGDLKNKDAAIILRGIWVQEFAEIDSLTRADAGTLKSFCSRSVDRVRDPYDRMVNDVPRRCVFIATVNEGGYLKDPTGSRRFWPLNVRAPIDVEAIARDRDQLWAEAAAAEDLGESLVLPKELWNVAGERQLAETTTDPWEDMLRVFLANRASQYAAHDVLASEESLPPDRVHSRELFEVIGIDIARNNRALGQRLRAVMEGRMKWIHKSNLKIDGLNLPGYVRSNRVGNEGLF
jgi:predicted P-loop ATPase